jgi:hypothetical protein
LWTTPRAYASIPARHDLFRRVEPAISLVWSWSIGSTWTRQSRRPST